MHRISWGVLGLLLSLTPAIGSAAAHPLDPLSAQEIRTVRTILQSAPNLPSTQSPLYYPSISLLEPAKAEVLAYHGGPGFSRKALVDAYDRRGNGGAGAAYRFVVDLRTKKLTWTPQTAGQPPVAASEYLVADDLVRNSESWKAAMAARGLEPADVYLDVWAAGDLDFPAEGHPRHRILRVLSFYRGDCKKTAADGVNCKTLAPNPYDRPIEGVVFVVCINDHTVAIESTHQQYPVPLETGDPESLRPSLPPLTSPGKTSYTLTGNQVTWDRWRFRVGFSFREGLTLHQIEYQDASKPGAYRPILYRASMCDIYVPYARDNLNWSWRSAFDVGEYHLGQYANPLKRGADVPSDATLIDATVADDALAPYALPAAIGIYEQFSGLLWSRTDPSTYAYESRGGRTLSVTWNAWIGNYIYVTTWIFGQDGSIEVKVGATGTVLHQGVNSKAEAEEYGGYLAPNIGGPSHQHFFSFRLDFDVDGQSNVVEEINTFSNPGTYGNGFSHEETELTTEGYRDANPASLRSWAVTSTSRENRIGNATGYSLHAGPLSPTFSAPDFPPLQRAQYALHPLWVTKFRDTERFAAGDYPNQADASPPAGLPTFIANAEPIEAQDVVVWHTIGFTHHPEPEEYPVMPVETIGFKLRPDNFFDMNPALDVAP